MRNLCRIVALAGTSYAAIAASLAHLQPRSVPTSDPRLRLTA